MIQNEADMNQTEAPSNEVNLNGTPPATTSSSPMQIKIKEERIDPEVEAKINAVAMKIKKEKEQLLESNGNSGSGDEAVEDDDGDENASNSDSDATSRAETAVEDKKSIEPFKSSNEILAELFKVFNAAPPDELLDDKNLLVLKKPHKAKKVKKEKKEKKEKKKKHKRSKSVGELSEDSEDSCKELSNSSSSKHKHKKKKRHKEREKEREKSSSKDKDKEKHEKLKLKDKSHGKDTDKPLDKEGETVERKKTLSQRIKDELDAANLASSSRTSRKRPAELLHKEEIPKKRNSEREKERERHNSFYNGSERRSLPDERDHEHHSSHMNPFKVKTEPTESKTHRDSRRQRENERDGGHISEISLSDEETYLKERSEAGRRKTTRRDTDEKREGRIHNSFYGGAPARSRSRERVRDREKERERERNRYGGSRSGDYERRRHRKSRSRSRSHDLGIDKKRLLEIARKNAISMFKRGNLPGCDEMSEEVKDKVLLKMRYGGRSVQDLTDFCKKISNGENLSDLSSDEDSDVDKGGNAKAFHHPFLLKEREPIVMHIRNATPLVPRPKTDDQTKAITMQFPVSSGQQHRMTEAWVPVADPKDKLAPLPALPAATQSTSIFKAPPSLPPAEKNIFAKPMPIQQQQEPAFKAVVADAAAAPITTTDSAESALSAAPMPVPPPVSSFDSSMTIAAIPVPPPPTSDFIPDVPVPSTTTTTASAPSSTPSVFPQAVAGLASLDVSSIISKRLNAMRRLQDNPMDSEAIKMMYNSQREMTCWASSKHLPGQFTGSTGVNVLTMRELNSGPQVWARRDQLTSTQPIHGGTGMMLLQKMGWKPGEGLGREKTGSLQPLLLDVKLDKRGLVSKEDNGYKRPQPAAKTKRPNNVAQAQQNIEDKHPVCLLNELTSKRKWTPPLYELVNEIGPSHNKNFMFSVSINGQTFTPSQASNTKKEAKVVAARFCLQRMGIIP